MNLNLCFNASGQFQPRLVTDEMRDYIVGQTSFLPREASLKQRFYCVRNAITQVPTCARNGCGKPAVWDNYKNYFRDYCGVKCVNLDMRGKRGKDRAASRNSFKVIEAEDINSLLVNLTRRDGNLNGNLTNSKHLSDHQLGMITRATENLPRDYPLVGRLLVLQHDVSTETLTCQECGKIRYIEKTSDIAIRFCSKKCANSNAEKIEYVRGINVAKYGVTSNLAKDVTSPEIQKMIHDGVVGKLYLLGKTVPEISQEIGISMSYTHVLLNKWSEETGEPLKKRSHSYLQKTVEDALRTRAVDFQVGDRTIIAPYEIDIVAGKTAVEINGLYWHSEKFKAKDYHVMKANMAEQSGYKLLQFWEHEVNHKPDIVISMIDNNRKTVFARNCEIVELTTKQYRDFLDRNHIQGAINSKVKLGLRNHEGIQAVMGFGHPRFNRSVPWELHRFANKLNVVVVGGFTKLLKEFCRREQGDILSYADRRFSSRNSVYAISGFDLINTTQPSYIYYHANKEPLSRYKAQKKKLAKLLDKYCPEQSEADNMRINGYFKVWDAGQYVYVLKR